MKRYSYGPIVMIGKTMVNVDHIEMISEPPPYGYQTKQTFAMIRMVSGKTLETTLTISEVLERISCAQGYALRMAEETEKT